MIEQRSADEVWPGAPKGIAVQNAAFELVEPRLIRALITEQGIRDPITALKEIQSRRAWLFPTEKST